MLNNRNQHIGLYLQTLKKPGFNLVRKLFAGSCLHDFRNSRKIKQGIYRSSNKIINMKWGTLDKEEQPGYTFTIKMSYFYEATSLLEDWDVTLSIHI